MLGQASPGGSGWRPKLRGSGTSPPPRSRGGAPAGIWAQSPLKMKSATKNFALSLRIRLVNVYCSLYSCSHIYIYIVSLLYSSPHYVFTLLIRFVLRISESSPGPVRRQELGSYLPFPHSKRDDFMSVVLVAVFILFTSVWFNVLLLYDLMHQID